jgi:two-component system, cell cycle sensor histidine kinase and response regulator CckA
MPTRIKLGASRETAKIVAIYALFGSAWIYLSDTVLAWLIHDHALIARIEVFKGLLFVLTTSFLLYQLIGRFARRNADTIVQLAESEARFQAIYHNVNDALFIHDAATGRIVDVNATMCNLFGFTRDEALQLQVQEISEGRPPYSREEASRHLELAASGQAQIFEWRSRKKDGTLFWSEVNMRHATINGEPRIIVMVRDISARKEAEEALRQSEEMLKALMEEMPAGVGWTDESGNLQYLNRCIIDWFGYTLDEVPTVDDWLERILPDPAYRAKIREIWSQAVARAYQSNAAVPPMEGDITCKDGSRRHVILNIRLVQNRFLYIYTDITKWEAMQNELLKTQKLESLGILAGGIAHDFNNILTGILGNISFLGLLLDQSHPGRKPLLHAEKASLRAAELARQLLTFARGGDPVKKPVAVGELVQEALSLPLRGAKVNALVEIPASLPAIEADEGQMHQAFSNVIINALQAMPEGGTLTVKGERITLNGENGQSLPPGEYVRLSFADQGAGISSEHVQRIFDPYFTTKAGGTGLGLASVHSIITRHKGRVEVQSVIGRGTTFTFYLPSVETAALEATCPPVPPSIETWTKGPILVMDDEEGIRVLTENLLEHLGYAVVTCSRGEEAVRLYQEASEAGEPFFAAIMDLTVPAGMGGKEAARQILAFDPAARLIVSSGYSNDPVMASYLDHGFCAAIVKPYRCETLQQALQDLAGCKPLD